MKRSLQRQLSKMVGGAIALAGLVAAVASFVLAYSEATEFQDDMLRQIATLSAAGAAGSPSGSVPHEVAGEGAIGDPESRIMVIRLPRERRPGWLPADLPAGFHTLSEGAQRLRVFVRDTPPGKRTAVAQPTDTRDEIALNSALRTLLPLLLLPLLAWLIVRIVRSELAPITRLSANLDAQPADRPRAIADADLPDEITPFVHAINRLLERVNLLLAQQRRFIADAAHELRSPLTALSVQAQNLENAATLEAMRERVRPLREGIERARRLTEQLLNLARTQAGGAGKIPVDVSQLARELIAEHLPLAEARGIDLGMAEAARLVLEAEPETLRVVLKNALDNALRYTPAQGEVTLRLYSEGNDALIEVLDSGPGIPAAERERVFEPFHRIAGAGGEGCGLGLAIARDAAARLGGVVSLHERPENSGLVFRYRQPRVP